MHTTKPASTLNASTASCRLSLHWAEHSVRTNAKANRTLDDKAHDYLIHTLVHQSGLVEPLLSSWQHAIPARKRDRPPLRGAALLLFLTPPAAATPDGSPTLPMGSGLAVIAPGAEGHEGSASAGAAVLAGGVFGTKPPCRRGRGGVWRLDLAGSRLGLAAREGLQWAGGLPQALGCDGAAADGAEPSGELSSGVWKPTVTLEGD